MGMEILLLLIFVRPAGETAVVLAHTPADPNLYDLLCFNLNYHFRI